MEEYKFIEVADDADPTNARLKRLIDELLVFVPRSYLRSIRRDGDHLVLSWNLWKPSGVDRQSFQRRICEMTDTTACESVVEPEFRLPPSLERALREINAVGERGGLSDIPYALVNALSVWGLVDADYDQDFLGQTFAGPGETKLWFRPILKGISLTRKGGDYVRQGYLTSLK
jgi:hypothetical protein